MTSRLRLCSVYGSTLTKDSANIADQGEEHRRRPDQPVAPPDKCAEGSKTNNLLLAWPLHFTSKGVCLDDTGDLAINPSHYHHGFDMLPYTTR